VLKTAITATAFLIAGTAIASADSVENRQDRQYHRIEVGRENGSITWLEGLRLRAEQRHVSSVAAYLRDGDGHFSGANGLAVRRIQNQASEDIQEAKDNNHYRPWWLPRVGR
jgi:hypothetical protein